MNKAEIIDYLSRLDRELSVPAVLYLSNLETDMRMWKGGV